MAERFHRAGIRVSIFVDPKVDDNGLAPKPSSVSKAQLNMISDMINEMPRNYVETERGGIRVNLTDKPEAVVCVCDSKPVAVYEYCNLHGLWKTEL